MDNQNIYYVYVLFRPWDGSPFYIGKGKWNRWLVHQSRTRRHSNLRLTNIFEKASRLGMEIPKVKVRSGLTESEAFKVEIALITAIGRGKGSPLVNLTDGGEGASNPSEESRIKRGAAIRGIPRSAETKAKISAKLLGHEQSVEARIKIGLKSKAMWTNPETRSFLSGVNRGVKRSKEFRDKVSAFHKGRTPSIETRSKMSIAAKGRKHSQEARQRMSESQRKRFIMAENPRQRSQPQLSLNLHIVAAPEQSD